MVAVVVTIAAAAAWSTLDLGKTLPQTGSDHAHGAATAVRWRNSSHQGLTRAVPEPSRGEPAVCILEPAHID